VQEHPGRERAHDVRHEQDGCENDATDLDCSRQSADRVMSRDHDPEYRRIERSALYRAHATGGEIFDYICQGDN
jgi:hypothetical protein